MDQLIVGLWVQDTDFAERFAAYVRTSEYRSRLRLSIFTSPDGSILHSREEFGRLDVLLADSVFRKTLSDVSVDGLVRTPVELVEEIPSDGDRTKLYKYQPVNRLLEMLFTLLDEEACAGIYGVGNGLRKCRIISVYSAVGGAGKTTVAVNAARLLAARDARIGYLSLESIPSPSLFRNGSEDGFERLLYYAKTDPGVLPAKWHHHVTQDSLTKVYGIPSARHPAELAEMDSSDTQALLQALTAGSLMDALVIDLDSTLHPRVTGALACSDTVIWLLPDHVHAMYKTAAVRQELARLSKEDNLKLPGKSFTFLHPCMGLPVHDPFAYGLRIDEWMPYNPQWSCLHKQTDLWNHHEFHDRLNRWLHHNVELHPLAKGGMYDR